MGAEQGPPTGIPENLTSATSLLRYGDSRAAFGAAELDSPTSLMPSVSSSLTLHKVRISQATPLAMYYFRFFLFLFCFSKGFRV